MACLRAALAENDPFSYAFIGRQLGRGSASSLGCEIKKAGELSSTVLIHVSPLGEKISSCDLSDDIFTARLQKPVKLDELYYCLMALSGSIETSYDGYRLGVENPEFYRKGVKNNIRILLAEDNSTNQKVILRILDNLGYRADAVANGKEALAAIEMVPYDLVLMDIQMPELDGFEATEAIRRREAVSGSHIPIVAMTAHAMKGDREKCLAVGMDDYISKPLYPKDLKEVVHRALSGLPPRLDVADDNCPERSKRVFDRDELRRRIDCDEEVLEEILQGFIDDYAHNLEKLQKAFSERNMDLVRRLVHLMKGAAANMSANPLQESMARIEAFLQNGEIISAAPLINQVRKEFDLFKAFAAKAA